MFDENKKENDIQMDLYCKVDLEEKNIETKQENKQNEETTEKNYFGLLFFIIISCVLNGVLHPITLCWCIPMSLYVFVKVVNKKRIGGFGKCLSWVLISPIVGIFLSSYNEGKN